MPLSLAQAFDPRANSIGFLRWLMAFMVIFSHAGPISGFYGGQDLGLQFSTEQSIGGVAVAGFFFLSGFLITKSRMGKSSIFRYFWRRFLRIFPAFWLAFLATVLVLAPIAWVRVHGTIEGFLSAEVDSPLTYFVNNMWLTMGQVSIAGLDSGSVAGTGWNGSAYTLLYEFGAYFLVGFMGLFGMLTHRAIGSLVAAFILVLNFFTFSGVSNLESISSLFANQTTVLYLAPFAFGMLFTLWGEKIPIDDRLAVACIAIAFYTYNVGGFLVIGRFALLYFMIWFAVRTPKLNNWEKYGDFSYGVYIFAWPLMYFATFFGLQNYGWIAYHLTIVVAVHVFAYISWHTIEAPAMSLKNWTPKPLQKALEKGTPFVDSVKRKLVNPDYSSSNFAKRMRAENTSSEVSS